MARSMSFVVGGTEYAVEPVKVDRRKLYGWWETHAYDDAGNECRLVSTDATGTVIIPSQGIGLALLSGDGRWVDRSELQVVAADGTPAPLVQSSYAEPVTLTDKATDEQLLDCSITALYHLPAADPALIQAIGDDIYSFGYSYLDSHEASPAFVLAAECDGAPELFLLVGTRNHFEFIGLEEMAVADEVETDEPEDTADDLDFSMF